MMVPRIDSAAIFFFVIKGYVQNVGRVALIIERSK